MLYLALLLFLLALLLLWQARRQQKVRGLPRGRLIYTDTRNWGPVEKPLFDSVLGLTGKPDYMVRQRNQIIPVEVKSKSTSQGPFDSHIFQLAAYCLLVRSEFGVLPKYGILHYPNQTYRIEFTPELERATLDLIEEMQSQPGRKEVNRSHESAVRCKKCGFRSICDQKLL